MLQVTERDPSFESAYRTLSVFYTNLSERSAMEDSVKKVFELRRQLTLRERLRIEELYYINGTGELEKAIGVLQEMKHAYPSDGLSDMHLAYCFRLIGELENAATATREAIRLLPDRWQPYLSLIIAEIGMNRWSAAKSVYEEAHSQKIDSDDCMLCVLASLFSKETGTA